VNEADCEGILGLAASRADAAEVFCRRTRELRCRLDGDGSAALGEAEEEETSLRMIVGGRLGHASRGALPPGRAGLREARELVEAASIASKEGPRADVSFAGTSTPDASDGRDRYLSGLDGRGLARLARDLAGDIGAAGLHLVLDLETAETAILTSEGGRARFSRCVLSAWATLSGDGSAAHGSWAGSRLDHGGGPRGMLERLVATSARARRRGRVDVAGDMPVVLAPRAAEPLIRALARAFDGGAVGRGESPFGRWLGQKAFDRRLDLFSDRTWSGGPWCSPWDDEGVEAGTVQLVAQGRVGGFYGDLAAASRVEGARAGCACRARHGRPRPHPGHLVVGRGRESLAKLAGGFDECLLVYEVNGVAQETGEFYLAVLDGDVLRSGDLRGRAGPCAIVGNLYRDLNRLAGLSAEAEWVGGDILVPHLAFERLEVLPEAPGRNARR